MDPKIEIRLIGGFCPVQAEGTIDGHEFYFRARWDHWSLSIGVKDVILNPDWYYDESYGVAPDAGWMPLEEAEAFILKGARMYVDSLKPRE